MTSEPGTALLLHGLAGSAATWWRIRDELTAAGWQVTAPDLRGHASGIRRADYRHDAYADDALALRPPNGTWDLVVGHSLGGAIAVRASARDAGWARRLALLDPVLHLPDEIRAEVRAGELDDLTATDASLAAEKPHWHERDRREKVAAAQAADAGAVAATLDQNDPWDLRTDAAAISVPTLVLAGDPAVFTFIGTALAAELLRANPRIRYAPVAGAGHGPHRDRPAATLAMLREWAESPLTTSEASSRD
ncbi:alpha/beta fold hydrolase [Microbacteriaceae bacterium VKM Ac-2855]|nr:alpha/beta fold hydrolase [Microbacteriaceae bacterium VKM Ac-2855]